MAEIKFDDKLSISNVEVESTSFKTNSIGGNSFEIKIKGGSIIFNESESAFLLEAFRSKINDESDDDLDDYDLDDYDLDDDYFDEDDFNDDDGYDQDGGEGD